MSLLIPIPGIEPAQEHLPATLRMRSVGVSEFEEPVFAVLARLTGKSSFRNRLAAESRNAETE